MTSTPDLSTARAELAQAKKAVADAEAAEAAQQAEAARLADAARLKVWQDIYDTYDPQQLRKDVQAAYRRIVDEVANTPVLVAIGEYFAAAARERRAAGAVRTAIAIGVDDRAGIARKVEDGPLRGAHSTLRSLEREIIPSLVEAAMSMIRTRIDAESEAEEQERSAHFESAAEVVTAQDVQRAEDIKAAREAERLAKARQHYSMAPVLEGTPEAENLPPGTRPMTRAEYDAWKNNAYPRQGLS